MNEGHTKERLKELQSLPLERKVGFKKGEIAMLLKGYGNAIVPELAAEFIIAFMEEIK